MTGKEFEQNINGAIRELNATRLRRAKVFARDVNALIKSRVINKGENADGHAFGIYAASTQVSKRRKGRTRTPYPKINFSDTNRMWSNTKGEASGSNDAPDVYAGPTNSENIDKMRYNEERFGPIMELSDDERGTIIGTTLKNITNILKKYKLS